MRSVIAIVLASASTGFAFAGDGLVNLYTHGYTQLGDSGLFGAMSLDDEFHCETFEDGLVNTVGLSLSGGVVLAPGPQTDSVDGDDGSINGSGVAGHSYRSTPGGSITIALNSAALGGLPERVGFVWTDGAASSSLTVTVTTGTGSTFSQAVGPLGDASDNGSTGEDRFIAVTSSYGVAQVVVASSGGSAFEIDHVQFEDPVVAAASEWNKKDFDDDGSEDDLLVFDPSTGTVASWLMNGYETESGDSLNLSAPASWQFVGAGATDNTRKTFLFWRDTATGLFHVWKLSSHEVEDEGLIENVGPVSAEWNVLAIRDVDGDLDADVIFKNSTTKNVVAWIMDNHSVVSVVTLGSGAGLTYVGSGDLNGDHRDDLLWRDGSGLVRGWLLGNSGVWDDRVIENSSSTSGLTLSAVGDLDGDGCDDLVWRSSNGNVKVWLMAGLSKAAGGNAATSMSANWKVKSLTDLNGDGKADLVFQNSANNSVKAWCMDGTTKLSGSTLTQMAPGWTVLNY